MNPEELQSEFLSFLICDDAQDSYALYHHLSVESRHRLQTYRHSYIARVLNTFCDRYYSRASFYSRQAVQEVLRSFFYRRRLPCSHFSGVVAEIELFLLDEENERFGYVRDLMLFCGRYWQLLQTADPVLSIGVEPATKKPGSLYLLRPHVFMDSKFPLYTLWVMADEETSIEGSVEIEQQAEAIFAYKNSRQETVCVQVEGELVTLLRSLSLGLSLEASLHKAQLADEQVLKSAPWILAKLS